MTPTRLQNIALYYCQRFVVSEAKLADYLKKRIYREVQGSAQRHEIFDLIPALVEQLAKTGYVNDKEAASSKLRAALRSGYAAKQAVYVASRSSMVKGERVKQELEAAIEDTLPGISVEDIAATESAAVMALTALKRFKRGPFRIGRVDEITKRRDISWLQRRGYSFGDIKKVMGLDEPY